jgi:hypothetical protein
MVSSAQSLRAIEILRINVWTAELPLLKTYHDALESDINNLLASGQRNLEGYGEQTTTTLQNLPGPHWKLFFSEIQKAIAQVVIESGAKLDEGLVHLRAWASILQKGSYDQRYLRLSALHNHSPAFLSAVYYLKVPENLQAGDGGTFFVNPFAHPLAGPNPGVVIPAVVGQAVIFPSSLMHGPAFLDFSQSNSPRVVIAVDAHLIPK